MNIKELTEHEDITVLVSRIRDGDREAFMTVCRLYQQKVYMLAYSTMRNRDDAMDVVQETFLRLFQKIHTYRPGNNFQNWLLRITKNICVDFYRRYKGKKGQPAHLLSLDELGPNNQVEAPNPHDSDIRDAFSQCLEKLSDKQRMIFMMKHYNDLDYKEMAEILNVAVGTVKSLHFKAVTNMKTLMRPYLEGEA